MDYIYAKSGGQPTDVEKLTTTFKQNGKIESVREIKRFLEGYSDSDKLAIIIGDITGMIPEEASVDNQLADKRYVNDKVSTDSATFRQTWNLVTDLSLTTAATHGDIEAALATAITTADNNDYCYVEIPTADATPTEIARTERYKFNGTVWAYEYGKDAFTSTQWAAINSGITAAKVQKLDSSLSGPEISNLAAIIALVPYCGTITMASNAEWKLVLTNANNSILLGKRADNSWYYPVDLDELLDLVMDDYTGQ